MAAEETTPTLENTPQLAGMNELFSGGVMNPLAKEQVRLETPPLPQIHTPPAPNLPGSQIPMSTGNYSGELNTPMKYANALKNHMENPESYAKDQYKYGKNYAYDADYTGLNFQRYYNAPKVFKEVGFSPWRDNEKLYNEKMTWWDSFKRSAGQSGNLMGTGFTSMLPWNAWDGDDTDLKGAKEMERAHAIGADNRGGVGAFFNNLTLDAGYTLGIGAEFAAEELAIWGASTLAAAGTGGASWGAAAAETGLQVGKLVKNFGRFGKVLDKFNAGLKSLKDVDKARDVFNYVKSGKPIGQLLDILTPGTATFAKETYNAARTAKELNTGENIYTLARASRGVGAFYRDTREIAAVLSESKLEGGSVELEMRKKLTDSYFEKNGKMPDADEYQRIDEAAYDAGRETYLWNLPALWISNKIVFDKAFKGIKPLQTFRKEMSEGLAGKLTFDEAAAKAGGKAWDVVKTGMKADMESLFKAATWQPKNLLRNGLGKLANYTHKNVTEALQEQYQDAVSVSMKQYHEARFTHPGRSAMHESWGDIFAQNVKKQFTTSQGWETFASGFLMGSLVQVPQHLVYDVGQKKLHQLVDKEGYNRAKEAREARTIKVVNALNAATVDPQRFFNPNVSNAVSQGILNEHAVDAATDGDAKKSTDITDESIFEHFHTLLQTDKLSLITDYLKDMKGLSAEELEQAYGKADPREGDAKQYYDRKIDSMLERADYIERRSKYMEDKFGNPFNPHKFSGKDAARYDEESANWQGWEDAKKMAVFADFAFDRSVGRMKSIVTDMNTSNPVANAPSHEFTLLFDSKAMIEEATMLRGEITGMNGIPGTKREAANKQKKLDALDDYMNSLSRYRQVLKEHSKFDDVSQLQKDDLHDSLESLHKALTHYTKVVANLNDSHVLGEKVDEAFIKIKDFYQLKNDSSNYGDVINKLLNPDYFTMYAQRSAKVHKELHAERLRLYRASFEGKLDNDDFNQLLNGIYDLGAYLYPNDNKKFKDEGIIPTKFYDVTTGDLVPSNSDKYRKIMDLIEAYEQTRVEVEGKDITEAKDVAPGYNSHSRYKINEDKRTYKTLAKQFGFDPEAAETKVDTHSVLNAIINSKNATYREKALARRLLTVIPKGETISFVNNLYTPGLWNGATVTVDARYSSQDYKAGKTGHPVEHVILHELMHRLTSEGLRKDPKFAGAITKLLEVTKLYQSQNRTVDPLYGSLNEDEFIAEAMSNETFQQLLKEIPFEGTGTSAWEEFLGTIKRFFARIFGIKETNTVLDEALFIITSKINADTSIVEEGEKALGEVKITSKTPLAVITEKDPELLGELVEAYKTYRRELYGRSEDENVDTEAFNQTDEEIKASTAFKEFLSGPFKAVKDLFEKHNLKNNRTAEPEIVKGEATSKPQATRRTLNTQMKQDLLRLEYDMEDINKMSFAEATRLIAGRIKPGSEAAAKARAEAEAEEAKQKKYEEVIDTIEKHLEQINTISGLEAYENTLGPVIATTDINSDVIIAMINAKKLNLKVTYDNIEQGTAVRHVKYGTVVVQNKDKDGIKVTIFGDPSGKIINIKKEDIESEIDYMEGMDIEPVDATDIENENIQDSKEERDKLLADEEERKKLENNSLTQDDDDLLDGLGDNCTPKKPK